MSLRLLFATGEALPFSKTGGLADVAHALPAALARQGLDVRVLTPAYRGALDRLASPKRIARLEVRGQGMDLWEGQVDSSGVRAWLLDHPPLYARPGTPYADAEGREHADNAWRFGCFSDVVARLGAGQTPIAWTPQIVHLNDWHTGLAAPWLREAGAEAAVVFTIHNLAYQGVFDRPEFDALGLPARLWSPEELEFYGGFSFMKAGLLYADALTTVSPTYAREIQTAAFGERLDGVLRKRSNVLQGIVNGIDTQTWNPLTDPHLPRRYGLDDVDEGKRANKLALQAATGLSVSAERPLFGFVGRLVQQKGADLLLPLMGWFKDNDAQLILLGAGDRVIEDALLRSAGPANGHLSVRIGYDEKFAHCIEAASDFFLMPSRFEPCGLNQMYSQRYGSIPVVRRTGGLADTVSEDSGILFDHADAQGLRYGLDRASKIYRDADLLRALRRRGMSRDFDWSIAARHYAALYEALRKPANRAVS